jgi:hypothetical protein
VKNRKLTILKQEANYIKTGEWTDDLRYQLDATLHHVEIEAAVFQFLTFIVDLCKQNAELRSQLATIEVKK